MWKGYGVASRSFWTGTVAAMGAALVSLAVFLAAGAGPAGAAFPGENGRIAFIRSNDVWTMNPDGSEQTNLTNTPEVWKTEPSFSPDGTKLVFEGRPPTAQGVDTPDIYTVNADGTGQTNLTDTPGVSELKPAWSPDGGRILFFAASASGERREARTMDADGTDQETLASDVGYLGGDPDWSPDGTRIAFVSYEEEGVVDGEGYDLNYSVSVVGADGSDPTRVAGPYYEITYGDGPTWSPDGERVAFSVTHGPDGDDEFYANTLVDIHVADVDGSPEPRQIRTRDIGESYPAWSPDGERLATDGWVEDRNGLDLVEGLYVGEPESPDRELVVNGRFDDIDWGPLPGAPQQDAVAPTITRPRPAPGSEVRDRTPTVRAVVRDETSELAKSDIELRVDGRTKSFSYDPQTDRLSRATKKLAYGRHTVEVEATDGSGNTATERWSVRVVRR